MNSATTRRKSALTLVDYLVIAATVVTFLAVVAINTPNPRKRYLLQDTSSQTGMQYEQSDLTKMRVKLATMGS